MTNLGRTASPVIRYRTGDVVVKCAEPCPCGRTWLRLEGGILGRADDMVNVRGVNVYPASIEAVVRRFDDVVEFRSIVSRSGAMRTLAASRSKWRRTPPSDPARARRPWPRELREALGLTVPVDVVEAGTLPRFEMKARRFIVEG